MFTEQNKSIKNGAFQNSALDINFILQKRLTTSDQIRQDQKVSNFG